MGTSRYPTSVDEDYRCHALFLLWILMVLGVLERVRAAQGLNAARFATLLMGQKDDVSRKEV